MNQFDLRTAFVVLLCVAQIIGNSSPSDRNTHNLSLNQSSVPLSLNNKADNFTDLLRLEDVLMVFNLKRLANKWTDVQHELKPKCAGQMTEYFRGLQQHKLWAVKSKQFWCIIQC